MNGVSIRTPYNRPVRGIRDNRVNTNGSGHWTRRDPAAAAVLAWLKAENQSQPVRPVAHVRD